MGKKTVQPVGGKFKIDGKDNKSLELTLDDKDLDKYIVEQMDGADMNDKLPATNPQNINWFACFSVYNKKNGKKNGYANVKYSFPATVADGQKFFVAYNKTVYDVTEEVKKNGKVSLSEGDPAAGTTP